MSQKTAQEHITVDRETRERVKFLRIFSYVGIPIGIVLLVKDFFTTNLFSFYLTLGFVIVLILNLVQLKIFRKYELGFALAILSFASLIITLFFFGDGNIFVWIAPFGAATFFLMGSRNGAYITLPLLIVLSFAMLANNLGMIELPSPKDLIQISPDFVASIIMLFLFILIFQETIEKKQRSITESFEQLEDEHRKDESIFSIIETGLVTADENEIVTFINETGCELLRTTREEVIGKSIREAIRLERNGETIADNDSPFNRVPAENTIKVKLEDNINIKRFAGELFPAGMNIIYTKQDSEARMIVVFSNLSAEKEISQFKEAFLASMQHQITIPLSILRWNTELFRETEESLAKTGLTKNDIINETKTAIERIVAIQNKILTSSRLEQGFFSKDTEDLNAIKLTEEAIQYFYLTAKRKGVLVNLNYNGDIKTIKANKIFLSTVIENIVSNAIKYSRDNGIVDVQIRQEIDNVIFKVADNGIGISKEEQKHIFEKFFRSENVTKKSYEGSGLGLYINKILVSHMGGEIWFESNEGVGTTFYVKIPNKAVSK